MYAVSVLVFLSVIGTLLFGIKSCCDYHNITGENYHWAGTPTNEDVRHCAPARSYFDCMRALGYHWEPLPK